MRRFPGLPSIALVLLGLSASAWAGPPLVCHPIAIDGAVSLPFGDGAYDTVAGYDRDELTRDSLALLTNDMPVLVRMETLRRASSMPLRMAPQRRSDPGASERLDAPRPRCSGFRQGRIPLAWFDAGYAIETFKQTAYFSSGETAPASNLNKGTMRDWDGVAWVAHALASRGNDPRCSSLWRLIRSMHDRVNQNESLRAAIDGAADGSLLAKNLLHHFGYHGESTMAELRAKL
jgi:hypothetical protein